MGKKIIAVNAGPRKGWNTDTLITEAAKGAESKGAVVEKFDLFFDPEAKKLRHETVFPQECAKAYDMGAALVMKENV